MKNSEVLKTILAKLEQTHPNLYHSVTPKEIRYYIASLGNIDNLKPLEFDMIMLKLFAMFKDAHTRYMIPMVHMDKKLVFIKDKVYLKDGEEYKEVKSIGNKPIKSILEKIASMQSYETKAFLHYCMNTEINNEIYYEMLGLAKWGTIKEDQSSEVKEVRCLDFVVDNNGKEEIVTINSVESKEEYEKLGFVDNSPIYSFETREEDNVLMIKYRECAQREDYPFAKFVEDIKKEIESKDITQYVLDLRGNIGGDSSIIKPLTEAIKNAGLEGALLIDNGVFSSGRLAVANFIKEKCKVTLVGEPTGGAAASYGNMKHFIIKDDNMPVAKKFTVSSKFVNVSRYFDGNKGSIQPDILVRKTIQDLRENKDSQLEAALDCLAQTKECEMI